jgi:integrase
MFTKASDWGRWSGKNPTQRTSLGPRRDRRKNYRLTDEQIVELLNRVDSEVQLLIAVTLSTGMRVSELAGLRWGSVDLERGILVVQETFFRGSIGATKTHDSERAVPIGMLREAFRSTRPDGAQPNDFVFVINGKSIDDRAILRKHLRPVAEELGF